MLVFQIAGIQPVFSDLRLAVKSLAFGPKFLNCSVDMSSIAIFLELFLWRVSRRCLLSQKWLSKIVLKGDPFEKKLQPGVRGHDFFRNLNIFLQL